jgi:hypothetical protein
MLIASLPRGAVAGWGVWMRSETMGCGVVFCLKSISWGSLAEHAIDHIALEMVYLFCLCLILILLWYYLLYHISIRFLSYSCLVY